jgi:hypothetical protein
MIKFNFSLFFFFLLINQAFTQGNLQFNQVLSLTNGANVNVPTGKVWKVEAINLSSNVVFAIGSLTNVSCQTLTGTTPTNRRCFYTGNFIDIAGVQFSIPTLFYDTQSSNCNSPCPTTNPLTLSTSTLSVSSFKTPIWLESGKNITIIPGSGVLISVIEFNIVP